MKRASVSGKAYMKANTALRNKEPITNIIQTLRETFIAAGYTSAEADDDTAQWQKNHGIA